MGASVVLSGNDTLTIDNHVFADFADGDVAVLKYPNKIAVVKTGKNGNSIYALNESGKQAELDITILRGGADDRFLLNKINQQQLNFAGTVLMIGQFIKKLGDGRGNIASDTYVTSGGVFTEIPEAKSNVEGDTKQSTVTYKIMFSNAPRTIT